ncbi:MAG: tRNA (adenosine(37)-N6)-dimethylallyltransferase MiaA [Raineya sp.]
MAKKTLLVLVGATAVGKTDLSIRLAQTLQTAILSADSRQFFREMQIGTARPTPAEMQNVTHYLLGHISIEQTYTVSDFEQEALHILEKLFETKNIVILTGGSGLYVKVLCEGIDAIPQIEPHWREKVQQAYQEKGLAFLQSEVARLDANYFAEVDQQNPQRLMRALEVCWATGKPFSSFRQAKKKERPFRIIKIGLERPRAELYERINSRVDAMLENGLLDEVKKLLPYKKHNALQTVGYKEIFDYLEGKQTWHATIRLIKQNTRHYAKRQMTWFKKDKEIQWFAPEDYEKILQLITTIHNS